MLTNDRFQTSTESNGHSKPSSLNGSHVTPALSRSGLHRKSAPQVAHSPRLAFLRGLCRRHGHCSGRTRSWNSTLADPPPGAARRREERGGTTNGDGDSTQATTGRIGAVAGDGGSLSERQAVCPGSRAT